MGKEKEVWRDIPGYEGYYQVSNTGMVRSLDRWVIYKNGRKQLYKGKIIDGSNTNGYKQITLSKNGEQEKFYVHQLVAITFLKHTPDGHTLVCDHIDGDKLNNRVENLQIVTQRQNSSTCFRKDRDSLTSEYVGVFFAKGKGKWAAQICFDGKQIHLGYFDSEIGASNAYYKALGEIKDNSFNSEDYKPKWTSKYKGISFRKNEKKWVAQPYINGKQIYLGSFATEEEAYQAIQNINK